MRFLRIFILILLMAPALGISAETCCCAAKEPSQRIAADYGSAMHLEAASRSCYDPTRCVDCALCHLSSFSPVLGLEVSALLATTYRGTQIESAFSEVVPTVLTPPPTL